MKVLYTFILVLFIAVEPCLAQAGHGVIRCGGFVQASPSLVEYVQYFLFASN